MEKMTRFSPNLVPAMSKPISLSKSTLLRSIQCQKSLFLYKNFYNLRDKPDKETQRRFNRGHQVGFLARELFPGGKDVSPPNPFSYDQSVKATQVLTEQQFPVIYEASFRYQGITVALDILVCREGKWYGYEVKSSVKISPTYLQDATIQYLVITRSGLPLSGFSLITVNNNYTRQGPVDIQSLFRITNVAGEIDERIPFVESAINDAVNTLTHPEMPDLPIGPQCYKPYLCDYKSYCWDHIPKNSIFESAAFSLTEKFSLYQQGMILPADIPTDMSLPSRQRTLLETEQLGKAFLEEEPLRQFLARVQYPVCFFDLEAAQHAVPPYDGVRPYQAIPFQYSVIRLEKEGADPQRFDFLAPAGADGRSVFVEQFLADTKDAASILVFNELLEAGQLRSLSALFPEYGEMLRDRLSRMVDMETPFKQLWYYHPAQKGGFSMKAILPVLAPKFHYGDLKISDGFEAMALYEQLHEMPEEEKMGWEVALKDYCHMDTYGLLQVWQALKRLV